MKMFRFLFCLSTFVVLSTLSARANVYATDIKLNGSLNGVTNGVGSPVTITYHLNQPATLGVTIAILQGVTKVASFDGGTNMGLNTVVWGGTNNSGAIVGAGTYSVSITAGAEGFATWQQISVDTNAGNYAYDPNGIAVDNNSNSPYYGRVVVGCSSANGTATNPVNGAVIKDGIYKMNSDGGFADEGGFGYGDYTMDDSGDTSSGEMPTTLGLVPWRLRIGDDDRIYMLDWTLEGAIVAFDMEVTTNQIVIDDGGADDGELGGPHNYAGNPDFNDLGYPGIGNFDVTSTSPSNAAVWLCDSDTPPNWGIWMYHLVNGQSDTNDTGTQAVATSGDLSQGSSGGCTVDASLDIFCGQSTNDEVAVYDAMLFANWNLGVLPPMSSGFSYADGDSAGEVKWGYGCGVNTTCTTDPTFSGVQDVVINSRTSPTIVACPMGPAVGPDYTNGIRLLNAVNGSIIESNLDFGQSYTCAAWDNVGNLYGASSSRNVWRAWSPPGASTNTTVAVAQITISAASVPFQIASISAVPSKTIPGTTDLTINFTSPGNPASSAFTLVEASSLNGPFTPVSGASITGASGIYQATASISSSTSPQFFAIEETGQ